MLEHLDIGGGRDLLFLMASCDTANSSLPKNGYSQHKGLPVQMKNLFYY